MKSYGTEASCGIEASMHVITVRGCLYGRIIAIIAIATGRTAYVQSKLLSRKTIVNPPQSQKILLKLSFMIHMYTCRLTVIECTL